MKDRTTVATLTAALCFLLPAARVARPDPPSDATKTAGDPRAAGLVRAVFAAHNRERAEAKLPALSLDSKLTDAARLHASDMASHDKMSHEGSDGSTPSERIKRQGAHPLNDGENVASGYPTVDKLMRGWMESPPHRENILGKFSQVGIAVAWSEDDTPYWCVNFATPWPKIDAARASEELVNGLNKVRSSAKVTPLKSNPKLMTAAARLARAYAEADSLDIKDRDDVVAVVKRLGYRYRKIAESAASGQPEASDVVKTWTESEAHRQHLLDDFTEIGVAVAESATDKPYWCLVLARPLN